uniref:Predicted protein n=1 Tax=Hordeum vulgare subsp. vulgare TaxID=112509 RepID=F2D5U2_HORVV|nr:predicted protein [Hordeum vulgare subsp. vulgare]
MAAHAEDQALPAVGPREARAKEGVVRGVARAELEREVVALAGGGEHAGGVRVLERRQRRHVRRRLAEERVLGPFAGEARHLVVLVRLRPLVRPPPQPARRVRRRLVGQHRPHRRHGQGRVRHEHDRRPAAAAVQRHRAAPLGGGVARTVARFDSVRLVRACGREG